MTTSHLHSALDARRYHQASVVLQYTANYDQPDEEGLTPLMKCCKVANNPQVWSIIRELVHRRARLDLRDKEGRSVLHLAAVTKAVRVARLLISTGDVDLQTLDNEGNTPLHIAAGVDAVAIAKSILAYLLYYEMDVDVRNKTGLTPLMSACQHGHLETARMLVKIGAASLTMKDYVHHKSAMDWLREVMVKPFDVDPFRCDPEILIEKKCQSTSGTHSARSSAKSTPCRRRRVQSAPPMRTTTVEPHLPRPATLGGWTTSADKKPSMLPLSVKQQLRPLFDIYSIQETTSYRPPAVTPRPPTPPSLPPTSPQPRCPKAQARQKLQKFIHLKRAESIVKALTGHKHPQRQPKRSFHDVVMSTLCGKLPRPEGESRKAPMKCAKDLQETSSCPNRKRFVTRVRSVVQMHSVTLETIDNESEDEG